MYHVGSITFHNDNEVYPADGMIINQSFVELYQFPPEYGTFDMYR